MNEIEKEIREQLLVKSQEAFVMAIELYNKPTLKYRVEGFAFFICNAWELMLKAEIIKVFGENAIYYKDSDSRTISLENCIKKVFTNDKDPLRKNLEEINELRNTSTHFIIQEYEFIYVPLFQACVFNYVDSLLKFCGVDIHKKIPVHFINLAVTAFPATDDILKSRYTSNVYDKFKEIESSIERLTETADDKRFAIIIKHEYHATKKSGPGTHSYTFAKHDEESDGKIKVVKEIQDPNNTHPYLASRAIEQVNNKLEKNKILINFTMGNFLNIVDYFDLKNKPDYCFQNKIPKKPTFSYSMKIVDFIVEEIKKDENYCMKIREKLKQKKKANFGSMGFSIL